MSIRPIDPGVRTRLSVLFAAQGRKAVILRRGPRTHWHLVAWDLATDTFTPGQWMKGLVRLCDLSPSGDKLIYWAAQYHASANWRRPNALRSAGSRAYDPLRGRASLKLKPGRKDVGMPPGVRARSYLAPSLSKIAAMRHCASGPNIKVALDPDAMARNGITWFEFAHALSDDEMVFACDGRIYRLTGWRDLPADRYFAEARLLADLNDTRFTLLPAPKEAMRW